MRNASKPEQKMSSDRELIQRSLDGDLSAFRLLVDSRTQYGYAVAFRLLRDEENAKDVLQEAFIRVWNNLGKYRDDVKFTTWFYKIVINLCYDKIKMDSRRGNIFQRIGELYWNTAVADSQELQDGVEKLDLHDLVLSESKKLPPREYLVFQLRDVQNFSIQEVAETTGMSIGSIKTNLCYARRRIRTAINQLQEGK